MEQLNRKEPIWFYYRFAVWSKELSRRGGSVR